MPARRRQLVDFENLSGRPGAESGESKHKTCRSIEILVKRRAYGCYYEYHQAEIYARFNQYILYDIKYIFFSHKITLAIIVHRGGQIAALTFLFTE